MHVRVHGDTTDFRSASQPSASAGLPQAAVLPQGIADLANGGHAVLKHLPDLPALQPNLCIAVAVRVGDDRPEGPRRADEDAASFRLERDVVNLGAMGDELDGQDVARFDGERPKQAHGERHVRGDSRRRGDGLVAVFGGNLRLLLQLGVFWCKVRGYARPEALHRVAGAYALRRENVGELLRAGIRVSALQQRNVRRAAGVELYADDVLHARRQAQEVDEANALFVAASNVPYCDASRVVPSALLSERDCEVAQGLALIEMLVSRATKMSQTRRYGFVGFEE